MAHARRARSGVATPGGTGMATPGGSILERHQGAGVPYVQQQASQARLDENLQLLQVRRCACAICRPLGGAVGVGCAYVCACVCVCVCVCVRARARACARVCACLKGVLVG